MAGFLKRLYTPLAFDLLFGAVALLGLAGLAMVAGLPAPAILAAPSPIAKAVAAIGTLLAAGIVATYTSKFDQMMADDFLFHTLTKSAFVAMTTIIIAFAIWQALFAGNLGGLSARASIALVCSAWALSYFYVRIQGTRA